MTDNNFSDTCVFVTGSAQGLGYGIAKSFVQQGADVILADIDQEMVKKAEERLGPLAHGFELNVADDANVARVVKQANDDYGPIRVLVNNAGICSTVQIFDQDLSEWKRILEVNLTGAFICTKEIAKIMANNGGGKIINIGSLAGRSGGIMVSPAYSASKAGLAGLTKAAAKQLAAYNITVNCIAPSTLETNLISDWDKERLNALKNSIPLSRLGKVEDITDAVLFLASDGAGYISGATLDINGGLYVAP